MVHHGSYAQKVFKLSYNLIVAHWHQEDKLGTQEATINAQREVYLRYQTTLKSQTFTPSPETAWIHFYF